jgi:hypothetical protein
MQANSAVISIHFAVILAASIVLNELTMDISETKIIAEKRKNMLELPYNSKDLCGL